MHSLVLNDNLALVTGRDGYFLVNRNDLYVGKAIEKYGEYNAQEGEFLKSLTCSGDTVVEVGANIGSHTVGLAKRVGASGKVYAFEPQRACYALLQAQLALNELGNVHAFDQALGAQAGTLWLPHINYGEPGNFGGIALVSSGTERHEKVIVDTLDRFFEDQPVTLLKIDVEGMERQVLEGGEHLLERTKPLLYVENDRVEESPALIDFLLARGYRLYWHMPPLYNPDNHFRVAQNIYGNVASFNMLCVHDTRDCDAAAGLREIKWSGEPHPLANQRHPGP